MAHRSCSLVVTPLVVILGGCVSTFGTTIKSRSFTEIRPPSTLLTPGTLVAVRTASPLVVQMICDTEESLGRDFRWLESPTFDQQIKEHIERTFKLDGNFLESLRAQARYKAVRNVTMTMTNAKVYALTDAQVLAHVKNRAAACSQALQRRVNAGAAVTMITAVLAADVLYKVAFATDATGHVVDSEAVLKGLSADLGGGLSVSSSNSITGRGLFWGAKDDQYFGMLSSDGTSLKKEFAVILNAIAISASDSTSMEPRSTVGGPQASSERRRMLLKAVMIEPTRNP